MKKLELLVRVQRWVLANLQGDDLPPSCPLFINLSQVSSRLQAPPLGKAVDQQPDPKAQKTTP